MAGVSNSVFVRDYLWDTYRLNLSKTELNSYLIQYNNWEMTLRDRWDQIRENPEALAKFGQYVVQQFD